MKEMRASMQLSTYVSPSLLKNVISPVYGGLPSCDAVWTCRWVPASRKNTVPLKIEVVCLSETSVLTHKSASQPREPSQTDREPQDPQIPNKITCRRVWVRNLVSDIQRRKQE